MKFEKKKMEEVTHPIVVYTQKGEKHNFNVEPSIIIFVVDHVGYVYGYMVVLYVPKIIGEEGVRHRYRWG